MQCSVTLNALYVLPSRFICFPTLCMHTELKDQLLCCQFNEINMKSAAGSNVPSGPIVPLVQNVLMR